MSAAAHSPERTVKALLDGRWHGELEETPEVMRMLGNAGGFRGRVSAARDAEFPAEPHRYHLYVSYACPWAHRTIIYRRLKQLEEAISMSVLHPRWAGPDGWRFGDSPMSSIDHAGNHRTLYEVYQSADPRFTGRVTVPVLWDCKTGSIVNNQSGDIMRMLNTEFDAFGDASVDFYPASLRADIDELNAWLLPNVCAAVYRAGFARNQADYDKAIETLFGSLDELEHRLQDRPFLHGARITESDWHLFATLCRFDAAYFGALKCNLRPLSDYPALTAFTARIQTQTGIGDTVRFDHVRQHYYDAIGEINPTIVPAGPEIDYARLLGSDAKKSAGDKRFADLAEIDFRREVLELHRYLEQWLKGEITHNARGPARLEQALADDFQVIHPTGRREGKFEVLRNFAAAHASRPAEYALQISSVDVEVLPGGFCFASYREAHLGETGRERVSTALLRRRSQRDDIEWLHLHETLVAD